MRFHLLYVIRNMPIGDAEGADFLNAEAAIVESKSSAREMLAESVRTDSEDFPQSMSVADELGNIVFDAPIASIMSAAFIAEFSAVW